MDAEPEPSPDDTLLPQIRRHLDQIRSDMRVLVRSTEVEQDYGKVRSLLDQITFGVEPNREIRLAVLSLRSQAQTLAAISRYVSLTEDEKNALAQAALSSAEDLIDTLEKSMPHARISYVGRSMWQI